MTSATARAGACSTPAAPAVRCSDVHKTYQGGDEPVKALDGVSLEIRAGQMVALMGPSGCGKSTLLNLIGCVDLPGSGRVEIGGVATTSLRDDALTRLRRDRVGTVFQFFNLLPALSAGDNVGLPLVLQGVRKAEVDSRVAEALEAVGLSDKMRAFPSQLSGGQMQRVAIARATIHRPSILLADEPTGNLDSHTGEIVLDLLVRLAAGGQAILMATHSAEAAAVCSRVVRMQDGRIVS
jgi:putative ABC transport system ATP-binding protein